MSPEQREQDVLDHALRHAHSQAAYLVQPVSIQELYPGGFFGPVYAVKLRAIWPSSGHQSQVRVFIAHLHDGYWFFMPLSQEMWVEQIAEKAATRERR